MPLREYIPAAWHTVEPFRQYVPGKHIDAITDHLEAVSRGEILRLCINIPPRLSKSLTVSVFWPTWVWTTWAWKRFVFASYSAALSTKHSLDRRTVIQSDWYQKQWGERVRLSSDQNVKTEFQNDVRGLMLSTSIGGGVTGKGGDVIVVDDPHNPMQALSELEREKAIEYFDRTLSTRLDDPKTGAIVIIMQRLHVNDLSGHVLNESEHEWTHLCLPMEAERDEHIKLPSGRFFSRKQGELLAPERFDEIRLAKLKKRLGSYGVAGQLQQRPAPLGGGIFKTSWWRYFDEPPADLDRIFSSWDFTFKETVDGSFIVGEVWGTRGGDRFLLDLVRARGDFVAAKAMIRAVANKWEDCSAHVVEGKANGPAIISELKTEIAGIIEWPPKGYGVMESKEARAQAAAPTVESGNVYLDRNAPWLSDFLYEANLFPAGTNDQIDSLSQAIAYARRQSSGLLLVADSSDRASGGAYG